MSLVNSILEAEILKLAIVGVSLVEFSPIIRSAELQQYLSCIGVHLLLNLWLIAGKVIMLDHLCDQNNLTLFVQTE